MFKKLIPTSADSQRKLNIVIAWFWAAFGIIGLVCYVFSLPLNLADSIPILFAISVYANFVGHLSTAQAAKAEIKIENADIDVNT